LLEAYPEIREHQRLTPCLYFRSYLALGTPLIRVLSQELIYSV